MATLRPFRSLRPAPDDAALVAAVPYDVVNTDEARALADGNALSFLRVSRAEIDLPAGTDPHSDAVYDRAAANFSALRARLVLEDQPSVYVYELRMGGHVQRGVAGCYSLDEYDRDVIKKHERTRRDKEDDRTRHMLTLGAQTGPVFLVYQAADEIDAACARAAADAPLFDFGAPDGVRHTIWRLGSSSGRYLVSAFSRVPALYIADGHHRAASAARAREEIRRQSATGPHLAEDPDGTTFLAVAFPHTQVRILAYNRVVKSLGSLTPTAFLAAVEQRFVVADGAATPSRKGEISMYFEHRWRTLRSRHPSGESDPIGSLDVSLLQLQLLDPVLGIKDVRTDKRIEFVGGARGTDELERLVNVGDAAVAFSMHPVRVADLMTVSDAGAIMPPKSTWFEPKLRDGLLIHLI
jgi:uncharacterized protein (DUF1015 family)